MSRVGHSLMKLSYLFLITLSLVMASYNVNQNQLSEVGYDFVFGIFSLVFFYYHDHMEKLIPDYEEE